MVFGWLSTVMVAVPVVAAGNFSGALTTGAWLHAARPSERRIVAGRRHMASDDPTRSEARRRQVAAGTHGPGFRAPLYEPYNPGVALTVRDLLRIPGLDLRLVAGEQGLKQAIRWVHVSELADPTPWLKGGELLLTTGIGVGRTQAAQRAYLSRLGSAGLSGLGFGLGFSFKKVPKALVDAAERRSFPLFEVPYAMPFIAITEAVFTRLVAEQYDLLSRSLEAEHTLTRAVLDGQGVHGIVRALVRAAGGWSVLLDLHGSPLAAVPEAAARRGAPLWSALRSPRAEGLRFSMSLGEGGDH